MLLFAVPREQRPVLFQCSIIVLLVMNIIMLSGSPGTEPSMQGFVVETGVVQIPFEPARISRNASILATTSQLETPFLTDSLEEAPDSRLSQGKPEPQDLSSQADDAPTETSQLETPFRTDRTEEAPESRLSEGKPEPQVLPSQASAAHTETARPAMISSKTVPWLVLVDKNTDLKTFKRHMISKYLEGGVGWSSMGVLAMPGAPQALLTWAAELNVEVFSVSAPIGSFHAWCMTQFERVVFTVANTLITRDVRRLVDICANEADLCGASAGYDMPEYNIDPGVLVARPSKEHCEALNAHAQNVSAPLGAFAEKEILNNHFAFADRRFVDARYNTILNETKTVHDPENAVIVQYIPGKRLPKKKRSFQEILARTDRKVTLFEAERTGAVPRSVLYATLLTPPPNGTVPHSANMEIFKQHHLSKFHFGKIPWKNQAVIYTEDAFPEYRAWLESKGGKAISVSPLLCEYGRERYRYQFTKLHLWNLTGFDFVVYMDMDSFVTSDIRRLWTACPDGVSFPEHFESLLEGLRNYNRRGRTLCEQDFLNNFLNVPGIGVLDPSYNVMTFDTARKGRLTDAKMVHFRWSELRKKSVTPAERDFMMNMKKKLNALIAKDTAKDKAKARHTLR